MENRKPCRNLPGVAAPWGLTYYHWKRYNEARDYYLEAQKRGFDNQLIQYHLGLVFSTQGNWNEAYKLWEPILKENPDGPIAIEIKKRIAEPRR